MHRVTTFIQEIIEKAITDQKQRELLQMKIVAVLLVVISLMMAIINFSNQEYLVSVILVCFTMACMTVLFFLHRENLVVPRKIMIVATVSMFSYFIFSGGVQGVSTLWIFITPVGYMFFLGFHLGMRISLFLLFVQIIAFWTPAQVLLQYEYTEILRTRIPLIYACILAFAGAQEYFRHHTYLRLEEMKAGYEILAKVDDLTKIPNRRSFETSYEYLWNQAIRNQEELSVLVIDVDRFKLFNDNYGHLQGDQVLSAVARMIRRALKRSTDLVARYGGEEFVVVLPATGELGALKIATEIQQTIREEEIPHRYRDTEPKVITVSIGVASLRAKNAEARDSLLALADQAMYEAKKKGGDYVAKA